MALIVDLILVWFVFWSAELWVVTESVERCKQYPNPKNGHMVCDSLFRLFCAPECDEGFTFEFKPAVVYMCGPLTGEWFTYPEGEKIPWPDCVRKESSKVNNKEDDVATRRAQITRKIHQTHQGMFLRNRQMQPAQLTGHPNARYLHLFDYIQRAQQIYNGKQTASIGYNALEQQRQLELQRQRQQQKQKHVQIQLQMQRRQKLIEQQKLVRQEQNSQREMMEKQRQQRGTLIESPITNNQQHVFAPQSTLWRNPAYQNSQKNLQSNARVDSRFVSSVRAASWSSYYPETQQPTYERYSTYRTLHEKTRNNVANGNFNQQRRNPEVGANSVVLTQKNVVLKSSLENSQVERNLMPVKEHVPLVTVSQPVTNTWQRPDFNRVLESSDRNVTPLTLQPVQHNQSDVHVSPQLITNQTTSSGAAVKPTTQSLFRIFSSNQLEIGNQVNVPPETELPQLLTQTAKDKVNQIPVRTASSVFQTNNDGPLNMESKDDLNKMSQIERRGGVGDGPESPSQEKSPKKEKLFYFPIKRDTLIRLLPLNLQEKYRSLRETRNNNSTYEASIDKKNENSTVLEDMKVRQNVTQKMDSSTNISNFKYSIQQIKTGNDSITEYFDLLPQSTSNSSYQGDGSIKSNNATIIPSTAFKNFNHNFFSEKSEDENGII